MLMKLVVVAKAFEMGGDEHGIIHAGLDGVFDLRGGAVGVAQHDVIGEQQMHLDVGNGVQNEVVTT